MELVNRKKETSLAKQVREAPSLKMKIFKRIKPILLIPTGSTRLNLECSGNPFGGFATGTMVNIIGDSSAGKTVIALTMLAEICKQKDFEQYQLIYDDVEHALKFNIEDMFGKKLAKRLQVFGSKSAEDFYGKFLRLLKATKKPFIYIVDSWDALRTIEEEGRAEEFSKDGEVKGTYGQSKQKLSSEIFRNICGDLEDTNSFLLIISQTRMNLKAGLFGKTKIRSGGMALKFYATHEVWMSVLEHLKQGEDVNGVRALVKITKNKLIGKEAQVNFPIYYSYGIDDIGSCIDYLIEERFWTYQKAEKKKDGDEGEKKKKRGEEKKILTDETMPVDTPMTRKELIAYIEANNLHKELQLSVFDAWTIVDMELKPNRQKKYD